MTVPESRDLLGGGDVHRPTVVSRVVEELLPGDPSAWRPSSFDEWVARERTQAFLTEWSAQVVDERRLRRAWATWVFVLIAGQTLGAFALVLLQGRGLLALDVSLLKIVFPSVFGEVFGLGYLVAKYLFSHSLRHSLDGLALGAAGREAGEPFAETPPGQQAPVRGTE
ncbi:MAG: hypothetical protein ACYC1I_13025 [Acidimicrobiales bacterium]